MSISTMKNLYEILELPTNSTEEAIKSAYRKLARKYHPDVNQGDKFCIQRFKEVTEAYEILTDKFKKASYDRANGFNQPKKEEDKATYNKANKAYSQAKEQKKDPPPPPEKPHNDDFANAFNDILETFKKSNKKEESQPKPERGTDVYADVILSIQEATNGSTRTVNIIHTEKCKKCEGRKFLNGARCKACDGIGERSIYKKISVKIPKGVKHGSKIRVANEGNKGYYGGKSGDLYLNIKLETSHKFKYEGLNVLCTIPITPFEAALGANIEIPSHDGGKISMKIVPNTNSGQKFRISNEGMTDKSTGKKGDMIVTVNIEVPKKMSEEEIELYKKLQKANTKNVRENL